MSRIAFVLLAAFILSGQEGSSQEIDPLAEAEQLLPEPPREPAESVLRPPAEEPPAPSRTLSEDPVDEKADEEELLEEKGISGAPVENRPGYLGLIGDAGANGVRVISVHEGGPAARAGFRENDVIVAIDGQRTSSLAEMTSVINARRGGDEVNFDVKRGDRAINIQATLGVLVSSESSESPAANTLPTPLPAAAPSSVGRSSGCMS
jgi:membrane-associated protease RseP (regulator of RpoE activity)